MGGGETQAYISPWFSWGLFLSPFPHPFLEGVQRPLHPPCTDMGLGCLSGEGRGGIVPVGAVPVPTRGCQVTCQSFICLEHV